MRHSMKISISKESESGSGIMTCRNVSVRERILRFLLGKKLLFVRKILDGAIKKVLVSKKRKPLFLLLNLIF